MSRIAFLPSILFTTHTGDTLTIVPFLALARELAALFVPVQAPATFRGDLERSLMAQARQRDAYAALAPVFYEARDEGDRRWVKVSAAAAAVGSAVSIAGIVVYVLRRRDRAA